jgi:hypothetical protein
MKHTRGGKVAAVRGPREIRVRLTSPRVPGVETPDAWVVNGRVIRFLDPSRPDVDALPVERHRRFGLLRTLAHR